MTKWDRQRAARDRKEKAAAAQQQGDVMAAVKLLARIVPRMKRPTRDMEVRAICVRDALDVLAGEVALSK